METRFSSKVDGWLIPVMILSLAGLVSPSDKGAFIRSIEQARSLCNEIGTQA